MHRTFKGASRYLPRGINELCMGLSQNLSSEYQKCIRNDSKAACKVFSKYLFYAHDLFFIYTNNNK